MKISVRNDPEKQIRDAIRDYLVLRKWFVVITHGNAFQSGLPDLFATHAKYGPRWIEVKLPKMKGSQFTQAQNFTLPNMEANGTPVWVLTGADDYNYAKLFKRSNLGLYLMGGHD